MSDAMDGMILGRPEGEKLTVTATEPGVTRDPQAATAFTRGLNAVTDTGKSKRIRFQDEAAVLREDCSVSRRGLEMSVWLRMRLSSTVSNWGPWGNVPPVAVGKFSEDGTGHQVSPVSTPASTDSSDDGKLTLKDRRLALEQEVVKLKKKHAQEVNLHKALDRALQRPAGVLPRIPSYLPAKIQKLLAEVAVLEEEVIRLEDHVGFLKKELSDEAQSFNAWGAQKQPNNFNAANNVKSQTNDLSRPNHLTKIKLKKDNNNTPVPLVKDPPIKDVKEKVEKFSAPNRKPKVASAEPKDAKDSKKNAASKLFMSLKSNSSKETKDSKDSKENNKEPAAGPPSKDLKEKESPKGVLRSKPTSPSAKCLSPPKDTKSPRGRAAMGTSRSAAGAGPTPAPAVVARKPTAEVLLRFSGMQQPWKPASAGGANGKNNLFRQFNSVGWSEKGPQLTKQKSSSPRYNSGPNSSGGLLAGPKGAGDTSSPRNVARTPFTGGPNASRLFEKENLQGSAVARMTRSPGTSKFAFSVDYGSSTVDAKGKLGSKALIAAVQPASKIPTIEPNRLSEELVKCLVSIYNKLARVPAGDVRTKIGNKMPVQASRNTGQKSSSGDYSAAVDFYAVCKDSPRDIGPYKQIHEITVENIDSTGIASCTGLYKKLGSLMEQLERADPRALSHHEKLAFWINIYNVCMMHVFLERGIPSKTSNVVALMKKAVVNVGGYVLNALTIEHFILRLPCRPKNVRTSPWKNLPRSDAIPAMAFMKTEGMEKIIEHSGYGLDRHEPLVTFGLCCGIRSSPALRVYTPASVEQELETAKREFLQAAIGVNSEDKILVPKLLQWYMRDFAKDMESLLEWVSEQLSGPLKEALLQCLNHPREGVLSHSIEVMPYDFNFRYLFLLKSD
ncbi:hypothetical protein R1flu_022927 [Riccia fluitans]|uniref:DUF547 domain-containing protein n=1 Tax=Riccia fluitans TaxID=41844 RepID=A0ABD1XQM0_9MARC